ncbi:TetR/AcrR family transcriptional regulator [Jiangella alkaliphila]|uniref:DNA-binding transcriptional regulator, AcrR family n=1 Tax=Jiangella alkaliphila TaxID=419479 RepID=A0A1H2L4Q4_9ACTN|nr:TetR/AcrR family transcriptional regulator [Jiangella alkaliphila]SDU75725.1 DNA-binding transcriptional regulator, AcrR family [Jiangella alkaliphila]
MTKRQARGEARIEQILTAAAEAFAESGYEATSTNTIAAKAGISPGSLYQFFANKQNIAYALAKRYAAQLDELRTAAFDGADLATLPLDQVISAITGPLVEFNLANRGFKALFARPDLPPSLTAAVAPLHAALLGRVSALLSARAPELGADDVARAATVSIQLVRAMMPLIVAAEGAERAVLEGELRAVLHGYLEPVVG